MASVDARGSILILPFSSRYFSTEIQNEAAKKPNLNNGCPGSTKFNYKLLPQKPTDVFDWNMMGVQVLS
jgi:hypothetical protein